MTGEPPANEASEGTGLPPDEQRSVVRERYASIAAGDDEGADATAEQGTCCGEPEGDRQCCEVRGYSADELASVADGANLGLGCGNPKAIAELTAGEVVLDLGSGGGFDCFLAAREVGEGGHVIGVDMTPEMVERARANVERNEVDNVEFRLGEIENLPVPDEHVDVVISNCVVNLSPEKRRVFEEAYRVLRPGGRLAIADIVQTAELPADFDRTDPESVAGCVAGAAPIDELAGTVERAGFESVSVRPRADSEELIREWSGEYSLESYFVSAVVEGTKPDEEES